MVNYVIYVFERDMCLTQRFMCSLIICLSLKTNTQSPRQIFFQKWRSFLTVTNESHWKIMNRTVIFLFFFVYYWSLKKWYEPSCLEAAKQLNAIICSFYWPLLMFVSYACKNRKMFGPRGILVTYTQPTNFW